MIKYINTTVFNVDVQTIVNTVNCEGVMGSGLALEFKLRFPEMFEDYVEKCKRHEVKTGKPYIYRKYETPWIMNFPTKQHWKYPSKLQWIEEGLKFFSSTYREEGVSSIAFPPLGCSKGNLNWSDVKVLVEKYLQIEDDVTIYVCLNRENKATGIEGVMVNYLNDVQDRFWIEETGIREDIANRIINSVPINRFREVREIRGVGKQTYCTLFKRLYSHASEEQKKSEKKSPRESLKPRQATLF